MLGFLGPALGLIGRIAGVAGNAGKGSSDQRQNENQQALQRSQLLAQLYGTNQNATQRAIEGGSQERLQQGQLELGRNQLDLSQRGLQQQQRQFALQAPSVRGSQSVRGSIIANSQPASFGGLSDRVSSRIPTLSGGLTPASFSPETRQMGQLMQRNAIMGQLKGDPIDEFNNNFTEQTPTDFSKGVLTPPELAELQKSGLLEKILGGIGLGGSLIGAINPGGGSRGDQNISMGAG